MSMTGYFTLPNGEVPYELQKRITCTDGDLVAPTLNSMSETGAYTLYYCTVSAGVIVSCFPVGKVGIPIPQPTGLRIYLDTSAVSYLRQEDTPERMAITQTFWDKLRASAHTVLLSDVTLEELFRCHEPRRAQLFDLLGTLVYTKVASTGCPEVEALAQEIKALGVLPKRSVADTYHIAAAIHAHCDVIASWNFKHLTRPETVARVQTIARKNHSGSIEILSPERILEAYL